MRRPGIEPRANAWKAFMLPLHHRRMLVGIRCKIIELNNFPFPKTAGEICCKSDTNQQRSHLISMIFIST